MTAPDPLAAARLAIELAAKVAGPWRRVDYGVVPEWTWKEAGSLQDWAVLRKHVDWCGSDEEQDAALEFAAHAGTHYASVARALLAERERGDDLQRHLNDAVAKLREREAECERLRGIEVRSRFAGIKVLASVLVPRGTVWMNTEEYRAAIAGGPDAR